MNFNSYEFIYFFPVVLAVLFIIPKKARIVWLLAASYFFYTRSHWEFVILLIITTLLTYIFSRLIDIEGSHKNEERESTESVPINNRNRKKFYLTLDILISFGILAYFKFFSDMGIPLRISFYTFAAVGYLADVYRGQIPAEKNIIRFSLFISFFPNILSGPIERGRHLLPQLKEYDKKNLFDYHAVTSGAVLFLCGLFMKMVIADRAAIFVDGSL